MNEWQTENPKECGYYLVTWAMHGDGRQLRVSEFWFDGLNWFASRAYIPDHEESFTCMTDDIVAWMPKPKAYRKSR